MAAVVRAFVGYFFLVFVVRIVGRRPGKQMTPFEFVLIFFIGGLALTAIISADDVMASARDSGLKTLEQVDRAVLERNGEISISPMQATPRKA